MRPELPSGERRREIEAALVGDASLEAAHEELGGRYSRYELRVVRAYVESRTFGGG